MPAYVIGQIVTVAASFADINKNPVDPTAVALFVRDPTGLVTNYSSSITKDSTGKYHKDLMPTIPGEYAYRWAGTGAATDANEGLFEVAPTMVF